MGLFRSKKKISVSSTSTPLIGVEPQLLTKSMLHVIRNGDNLTERLVQDMLDGAGIKIRRAYRYARDNYTLGLPQGYTESFNYDLDVVEAVIEAVEGEGVTVSETRLDYADLSFHHMDWLYQNLGWDYDTDVIHNPNGNDSEIGIARYNEFRDYVNETRAAATPEDETPTTGTYGNGVQWRRSVTYQSSSQLFPTTTEYSFKAILGDVTADYDVETGIASFTSDVNYTRRVSYINGYTIERIETLETWTYGLDPTVDEPSITTSQSSYTEANVTQTYDDAWTDTESFTKEVILNDYYYFAAYQTESGERKIWLYRVDDALYPQLAFQTYTGNSSPFYPVVPLRRHNVDLCSESRFDTDLYITSNKLLKKIGINIQDLREAINENPDVGEIDHAILMFGTRLNTETEAAIEYLARFWDRMYGQYVDDTGSSANGGFKVQDSVLDLRIAWSNIEVEVVSGKAHATAHATADAARDFYDTYVEFRLQISENTYKRIKVYNPVLTNYVYQGHTVVTDLADAQSEDNNNFVIPLHSDIVDQMGALKRNSLYYDALQIVFNSYKVTKVKWYQTGLFKTLLQIAAIALVIYTGGGAAFATALANGAYNAALMMLIEAIVISYVISVGFKYLVKALGIENSFIVAIIAAAIAIYQLSVSGWNIDNAAWADVLLQTASGLSQGISANLGDAFKDLQNDFDVFQEEYKESLDALKEAQELLAVDGLIDPMEFVYSEPMINFNEYPSNYYERTIHNTNPGLLGYTMMNNYADIMLQLPQPTYE